MAQIAYRANLSSAVYPMTVAKAGRSVIVPGPDQNYDRRVDPSGEQKDAGIPQVIYMENVLPTANGYQSVGFKPRSSYPAPGSGVWLGQKTVSILGVKNIFGFVQTVELTFIGNTAPYIRCNFSDLSNTWVDAITPPIDILDAIDGVTFAVVAGVTYMMRNNGLGSASKIYTLTCATPNSPQVTFTDVSGAVTGVALNAINAICSAFNYLIAIDRATGYTHWSSTTTPLDFATSLVTGAGAETPTAVRSTVTGLAEHPVGFFIYTQQNVIAATYTGNARYPWKFREIPGSDGCKTCLQFSGNTNTASHIMFNNSGQLYTINPNSAELLSFEVTDFLEKSRTFDAFDSVTNTFSLKRTLPSVPLFPNNLVSAPTQISFFLDRYIIISYGYDSTITPAENTLSNNYCLVFDTLSQRYGKLKIRHRGICCDGFNIYFVDPNIAQGYQMYYDIYDQDVDGVGVQYQHSGILVLGKFEYVRSRNIKIEEIEIESSQDLTLIGGALNQKFTLAYLPTLDGKTFVSPVNLPISYQAGSVIGYKLHKTAKNFAIALKGTFDANTVAMKFVPAGKR